ncbi:MAG: L,D-transpeptidase [Gemmatimonadales bacterium]
MLGEKDNYPSCVSRLAVQHGGPVCTKRASENAEQPLRATGASVLERARTSSTNQTASLIDPEQLIMIDDNPIDPVRRFRAAARLATTFLAAGATMHSSLLAQSRIRARVKADVAVHLVADLAQRKLYVMSGTDTVRAYAIAIGDSAHPTPTGEFHIARIVWNPKWTPPEEEWAVDKTPQRPGARANPMRLVKIFFREPSYYIHGSNEPRSVGYALSHGCLRMEPMDAYHLARTLMEHGGAHHSARWYSQVLRTRRVTRTVRLSRPIAMEIIGEPATSGSAAAVRRPEP